ncbi:hypothetical protein [Clostridium minihomine]|uniref:hypothetical protein n=1 Tax=Clostridium minihomine TaxID=2045012 RepID=UPI00101AE680|nr:hypothetical protein [Clostridium minihomine]
MRKISYLCILNITLLLVYQFSGKTTGDKQNGGEKLLGFFSGGVQSDKSALGEPYAQAGGILHQQLAKQTDTVAECVSWEVKRD